MTIGFCSYFCFLFCQGTDQLTNRYLLWNPTIVLQNDFWSLLSVVLQNSLLLLKLHRCCFPKHNLITHYLVSLSKTQSHQNNLVSLSTISSKLYCRWNGISRSFDPSSLLDKIQWHEMASQIYHKRKKGKIGFSKSSFHRIYERCPLFGNWIL